MEKPEKIVYSNQGEVLKTIKENLEDLFLGIDCEVYLVGSSITGDFGKYVRKYRNLEGSDIDLVVFIENEKIPKNWKYLNTEKRWWELYRLSEFEIRGNKHSVEAMVVKKSQENFARKRIYELWDPFRIK